MVNDMSTQRCDEATGLCSKCVPLYLRLSMQHLQDQLGIWLPVLLILAHDLTCVQVLNMITRQHLAA